jgi:hypothetical protein
MRKSKKKIIKKKREKWLKKKERKANWRLRYGLRLGVGIM